MSWWNWLVRKIQGNSSKPRQFPKFKTFILEPILTPSGLVDSPNEIDPVSDSMGDRDFLYPDSTSPLDNTLETTDNEFSATTDNISATVDSFLNEDIEILNFIGDESAAPLFESGVFTVDDSGQVSIDFLYDGGGYKGELAIFSLEGMKDLEPGSEAFIQEAARRALTESTLGHVVIKDASEAAKFSGSTAWEGNFNSGSYQGVKTVNMNPGDTFGVMLVPKGTVQQVFDNPDIGGANRPLFSMATANPEDAFHTGQIADVTGEGNIYAMEDLRVDRHWQDKDYNDIIFQVRGATAEAIDLDEVIDPEKDWRETDLGQKIINNDNSSEEIVEPGDYTSGVFTVGESGEVTVDFLFDGGSYEGEVAVFNIEGLDSYEFGSQEFIREVARRALEGTSEGSVVISDPIEGAKFTGQLGEPSFNTDDYQGSKTIAMTPGGRFGVMLVPNGTVEEVFQNPALGGSKEPIFSLTTSGNKGEQFADFGDGKTFGFEDLKTERWSDREYNDIVIQIDGATGTAPHLEELIDLSQDWRDTKTGKALIEYISYIEDNENLLDSLSDVVRYAIERNANLETHEASALNSVTRWIVGLDSDQSANDIAHLIGVEKTVATGIIPGTYTWDFSTTTNFQETVNKLEEIEGIDFFYPVLSYSWVPQSSSSSFTPNPNNPIFNKQWHLFNTKLTDAWKQASGKNVVIGIIDDGLGFNGGGGDFHPSLIFNSDFSVKNSNYLNEDFVSDTVSNHSSVSELYGNPFPNPDADKPYHEDWLPNEDELEEIKRIIAIPLEDKRTIHGTAVAGVAAANSELFAYGSVGAAPNATLADLEIVYQGSNQVTDKQLAEAFSFNNKHIHIYNSSWKIKEAFSSLPLSLQAIENSIKDGRNGLGNIHVFAGGNDGLWSADVNYNGFANSRYTIAVAAVGENGVHSQYSELGASLLISAPSSFANDDGSAKGIITTDHTSAGYSPGEAYTDRFGGTSAAAALTSGIIALMLEVNPNLTWRDIQHILVKTANEEINDIGDSDWQTNGAGYKVNHKYGFGVIDAVKAVNEARTWKKVEEEVAVKQDKLALVNTVIPDDKTKTVTQEIKIAREDNLKLEWVEVVFDATHPSRGDLEIVLVSPDGTESVLASPRADAGKWIEGNKWVFTSARHWGESSAGTWKLRVSDRVETDTGTWNSWKLNFYGTPQELTTLPEVTIESIDPEASEDGNAAQFIITRQGDTTEALTVKYNLAGDATEGVDYKELSNTITIPAGSKIVTIPVVALHDYQVEGDETVELQLLEDTTYQLGTTRDAIATISDSTKTHRYGPFVYINPETGHQYLISDPDTWLGAQEQAQALGGNLVTINNQAENDWLVDTFGTSAHSAPWIGLTDSSIYNAEEGNFKWINDESLSYENWITSRPDNASVHPDGENFGTINLSKNDVNLGRWNDLPADYVTQNSLGETGVFDISRIGIIEIDPTTLAKPIINVMVTDDEAGEDGNTGQVVITRVGDLTQEVTINYNLAGDAINGQDYATLSGQIKIPAGKSLVTVPINALYDGIFQEGEETVIINLAPGEYEIGTHATGQVKINENHKPFTPEFVRQWGTVGQDRAAALTSDAAGNIYVVGSTFGDLDGNKNADSGVRLWSDPFITKYDAQGQKVWTRQLGTKGFDHYTEVAVDDDGNIFAIGYDDSQPRGVFGTGDHKFVKWDSEGNLLWEKLLGTSSHEFSSGLKIDPDGNVVLAGWTQGQFGQSSQGGADYFVAKYDTDGNPIWIQQNGTSTHDRGRDVAIDNAGNIYTVGITEGSLAGENAGSSDVFVTKYDRNGQELWIKQFGTDGDESRGIYGNVRNVSVDIDDSGKVYISAETDGVLEGHENQGRDDVIVLKLDEEGNTLWTQQFGGSGYDRNTGISVDNQGYFYVSGWTNGSIDNQPRLGHAPFLTKFDTEGNKLWTTIYGTSDAEELAHDIEIDSSGNVYTTGYTTGDFGGINAGNVHDGLRDIWLAKFPANPIVSEPTIYINPETGNKYFLTTPDTWLGAQEQAQATGGNLVSINSESENQWLIDTFDIDVLRRWIGFNDSSLFGNEEGEFSWVNGDLVNYTNWHPQEPNGINLTWQEGEDFTHTGHDQRNYSGAGYWNDLSTSDNEKLYELAGIAEIPANAGYNWTWTYFGEDLNTQGIPLSTTPNTNAAKADFLANLNNIQTVDFENFNDNDHPKVLDFGTTKATLSGYLRVSSYNSEKNLTSYNDTEFTIDFDSPQSAFGFTLTDAEGTPLTMTLHHVDGTTSEVNIPVKAVYPENSDSVLFYGVTDIHLPFEKITVHKQARTENLRFEDFIIGDIKSSVLLNATTPPNQVLNLAYREDTPLDLSNILVTDPDGEATIKLTLSDPKAGLLTTGTIGDVTSNYEIATGVWTASGAVSDLNKLLADLQFNPTANSSSDLEIATEIVVGTNTSLTGKIVLTGLPQNDKPTLAVEPTRQWVQSLEASHRTSALDVVVDSQGYAYVTGRTDGELHGQTFNGVQDGYLAKYDSQGNRIWTQLLGDANIDTLIGMTVDEDDNLAVVGYTRTVADENTSNAIYAKYDSEGNLLWSREYDSNLIEHLHRVVADEAGNFYAGGFTRDAQSNAAVSRGLVLKFDTNGNIVWTQAENLHNSTIWAMDYSPRNGHIYTAGTNEHTAFISEYDRDGNLIWQEYIRTDDGKEQIYGMTVDEQGNIHVVGRTSGTFEGNTSSGDRDVFVAKYNNRGDRLWVTQFGTEGNDIGQGISVNRYGNIVVSSQLEESPGAGSWEGSVTVLDANGNRMPWTDELAGQGWDFMTRMDWDDQDNMYMVGANPSGYGQTPLLLQYNYTQEYSENTPVTLKPSYINDPDLGDTITVTFTLSDANAGTLTSNTTNNALMSSDNGVLTVTGSVEDVNAILKDLQFNPTNGYTETFTISTAVTDEHSDTVTTGETIVLTGVPIIPNVTLNVLDGEATEDGDAAKLLVQLDETSDRDVTIYYTLGGTAKNSEDYQELSGEITIPAGTKQARIPIVPLHDYQAEGEETIEVTLKSDANYNIGTSSQATITIENSTKTHRYGPFVYVNPQNGHQYLMTEEDTWHGAQAQAEAFGGNLVSINSEDENNWLFTAFGRRRQWIGLNDSEAYGNTEGNYQWVNGEELTFTPDIFGTDNVLRTPEGEDFFETNFMRVGGWNDMPGDLESLGNTWENPVGIVEIDPTTLDRPIINVMVTDDEAGEDGNSGQIVITRVGKLDEDLTVRYNLAGDAVNGVDYQQLTGEITIPSGQSLVTLPIHTLTDLELENTEKLVLNLDSGDYDLGTYRQAEVTIGDRHPLNQISNEVLGRDLALLDYWTEQWKAGASFEELRKAFIASAYDGQGNLEAENKIKEIYQEVLQREATPQEVANARTQLENGATLSEIRQELLGFSKFINTLNEVWINPETGNHYFITTPDTWLGAQEQAKALGGNLVTINNATEAQWLIDTFEAHASWHGLHDSPIYGAYEGEYQWINGEPVTYTNWRTGEPNNRFHTGIRYSEGEDFIHYFPDGLWNDLPHDGLLLRNTRGIVEIVNPPNVTLEVLDGEATEDGDAAKLLVQLDKTSDRDITIYYTLGGTAKNAEDYKELSGEITIPAGEKYARIPVVSLRDYQVEGDETLEISLQSDQGYNLGSNNTATVTIGDSKNTSRYGPFVYVNPQNGHQYLMTEAGEDTWHGEQAQAEALGGNLVAINSQAENDWLVDTFGEQIFSIGYTDSEFYGTEEGSYKWLTGEQSTYTNWRPGEPNNVIGGDEDFAVLNQHQVGTWNDRVNMGDHLGIIEIDPTTLDRPIVNVMVTDNEAGEDGNAGQIVITRIGKLDEDLTINYSLSGNAENGTDYEKLIETVVIPAGQTLATIPIIPLQDNLVEGQENIILELESGDYQVGTSGIGKINIKDNNQGFNFNSFNTSNTEKLNFISDAGLVDGKLRINSAEERVKGAVWYDNKQQINHGFETTFKFQVTEPKHDIWSGDGFAFVIQNSGDSVIGGAGGTQGYGGIWNSLAIEFDTFQNLPPDVTDDPNNNHISVQTRGTLNNTSDHDYSLGLTTDIPNLADGNEHEVKVKYTPGNLEIFIDDLDRPVLTVPVDIDNTLNLDNGKAWIGFTGSTAAAWQNNDILDWSFSSIVPEPEPVVYTNTETGSQYLITTPDTWLGAQEQAKALGGNLVTVNNETENQWLVDTFGEAMSWLGYTDSPMFNTQEGEYKWVSGEESTYTNWLNWEPLSAPNNISLNAEGEDFTHTNFRSQNSSGEWTPLGQWNDLTANHFILPGIVEIPGTTAQILLPDTPYLSFNDSPFKNESFTDFYLETFEDGRLNTPGVQISQGIVLNNTHSVDSVDSDNGIIDGDGLRGHSLLSTGVGGFTISFDEQTLGYLPTHAGFALTDLGLSNITGLGEGSIVFEAFDRSGNSLGTQTINYGDNSWNGGTNEDRFMGATYDGGIASLKISSPDGNQGYEIDHIQYGLAGNNSATDPIPNKAWINQIATSENDTIWGITTDVSGNVYVTGSTEGDLSNSNAGAADTYLRKYDTFGNIVWTQQLGTSGLDETRSIAVDRTGQIYITGHTFGNLATSNNGLSDVFLVKFDAEGNQLNKQQIGSTSDDYATSLAIDNAGNVYLTGFTGGSLEGNNTGGYDSWVAKYDSQGNEVWSEQFGTVNDEGAIDLAVDSLGNTYLVGHTYGSFLEDKTNSQDTFVVKYNAEGVREWVKQIGTSAYEEGHGIVVDANNDIYIAGNTDGALGGENNGMRDVFVIKLDAEGNEIWQEQFGSVSQDSASRLAIDGNNTLYITGVTNGVLNGQTPVGENDAFVTAIDNSGNHLWTKLLGTVNSETSQDIAVDRSGNVYFAGSTAGSLGTSNGGQLDGWLSKNSFN